MPSPRPVLLLANPAAGSSEEERLRQVTAVLAGQVELDVVRPRSPEDTGRALSGAAGRDVIVMGGDGSIHLSVAALDRLGLLPDVTVGIIPGGTGNDLARGLQLPMDPTRAAQVAVTGEPVALDLLRDGVGGVVVNAAHAGAGAEATAYAEEVKGLLGKGGYLLGAVRAGISARGWRLRVVVDGDEVLDGTERALMVSVAVGRTFGGGTEIVPGAEPGDRVADVVASLATGVWDRISFALDLRRGRHTTRDDVRAYRARDVLVEALGAEDGFPLNIDGEVGEHVVSRVQWTVEPAAWRCRVPPAAT